MSIFSNRLMQWIGSLAVALFLLLSGAPFTSAATLQVAPVSLSILPTQAAQSLWLSNTGDEVILAQIRVLRWSQEDGQNRYEDTSDLVVSPPFVKLEAGQRRMVRVVRVGGAGVSLDKVETGASDKMLTETSQAQHEKSYRLIVDDLPVLDDTKGVHFVLQYSVPVFLPASNNPPIRPTLHWRLKSEAGTKMLVVTNTNAIHGQLADVKLINADGKAFELQRGLLGYVLPGKTMSWRIPFALAGTATQYKIEAMLNGAVMRDLTLSEDLAP
ncbi:fimbria/pilus periplasmic chaperone [Alcaligenaceae bacterium CGII-47]|nr:fimbria/pilus periplasmic chaperone [Alcaligenaceae bacterium CGII-47]